MRSNLKEMDLKDVQAISLEILTEFDGFCKKSNLRYTLAYGTMIGAIRHHGFIPWDDDIDVMMPRPDYDKFIELYKDNENYVCIAAEKKNSLLAYARLVEMKRTFVRPAAPWSNMDTGIWIDIFPVDGVEDDKNDFSKTAKEGYELWRKVVLARQGYGKLSVHRPLMWNLKRLVKKLLYSYKRYSYLDSLLQLCHRYDYDKCGHVSNLSHSLYASKSFFPKNMFEEYIDVLFDNLTFKCIKDFHIFLSMIYGDYMELPPIEKRKDHSFHHYYWKNV